MVNLSFSSRKCVLFLALFFIAWHPGFLGSEQLVLTTYYPAPYGGYVGLLTTGTGNVNTILARNAGNVLVGMATQAGGVPQAKFDVNGSFRSSGEMTGTMASGFGQFRAISGNYGAMIRNDGADTYMPLLTDSGNPYGVWNGLRPLRINNGTGDVWAANSQVQMRHADGGIVMSGPGGLTLAGSGGVGFSNASSGITGLCRYVQYWVNGGNTCSGTEKVVTWYGDNINSRCGMLFMGGDIGNPGRWTPFSCVGADYSGWMLCCKLS